MKKRKAVVLTIIVLVLGFIINFLFEIMPDDFKDLVNSFSSSIGLSYTKFWIICIFVIVVVMLILVWKQVINETTATNPKKQTIKEITRQINQNGKKSVYIENNKGDINVK